jgi:hypothetical protein
MERGASALLFRPTIRQRGERDLAEPQNFETHDCQAIVGFLFWAEVQAKRERQMMKNRKIETWFEPDVGFEIEPRGGDLIAPLRGVPEAELDEIKERLLEAAVTENDGAELYPAIRAAANEAAALAWNTPFPLLVFPLLFEEKTESARRRLVNQRAVWKRSRRMMDTAP